MPGTSPGMTTGALLLPHLFPQPLRHCMGELTGHYPPRANWPRASWRYRSCRAVAPAPCAALVVGSLRREQHYRVIGGDRVPGIAKHHEIVFRDQPVAGIARDDVDFAGRCRRIHEVRLHLPLRAERQPLDFSQRSPFGPRKELVIAGDRQVRRARGEVGDRADAELFGALARHHQRIGVLEAEFAQQRDVLSRQHRLQFAEQHLARPAVAALELVGPQRAGIVDIDVDVVAGQRVEDHVGAEAFACRCGQPGRLQPLPDQRCQHILFGEGFCADDVARLRACHGRHQCRRDQRGDADAAQSRTQAAAVAQADFDQRQQLIDGQRQHRRGQAAEQHEHPVLGLQPCEDVIAEAGLADRRRERRGADHPDRRGADARHHDRQRQRQFHREQRLPRRHADTLRRFQDRRIDPLQAGDGVAQHRQHRIERERQHRGQETERREANSEPRQRERRQRQQQWIEQRQQRQSRHRLHDAGKPESAPRITGR